MPLCRCWALMVLCVAFCGCHPPTNIDAFRAQVREWVPIGSSVDAAEAILEARRFALWEVVWQDAYGRTGDLVYGRAELTLFSFPLLQVWSVRLRIEDGRATSIQGNVNLAGP